jgi:glycerophosphoryl diester phosphodiesterase
MLVEKAHHWPVLRQAIGPDWGVGPGIKELRDHPGFARRLAESGRDVHVWVVNDEPALQLCQEIGATAVITDRPAYVLDLLDG